MLTNSVVLLRYKLNLQIENELIIKIICLILKKDYLINICKSIFILKIVMITFIM